MNSTVTHSDIKYDDVGFATVSEDLYHRKWIC